MTRELHEAIGKVTIAYSSLDFLLVSLVGRLVSSDQRAARSTVLQEQPDLGAARPERRQDRRRDGRGVVAAGTSVAKWSTSKQCVNERVDLTSGPHLAHAGHRRHLLRRPDAAPPPLRRRTAIRAQH